MTMVTNDFKNVIQSYLEERVKQDGLFAASYAKPGKSIDECCDYIIGEAKKRGNAVAMTDNEVFGLAVHYYDEDNIEVNKVSWGYKVSAPAAKNNSRIPPKNRPIEKIDGNKKESVDDCSQEEKGGVFQLNLFS